MALSGGHAQDQPRNHVEEKALGKESRVGGYGQNQPTSRVEEKVSEKESRVGGLGQNQPTRHVEEKGPEKESILIRVKDSLNLTKHLGFVSDLDSPANQAAIAAVREKEEREGVTEVVPQAPLSERLVQGLTSVAETAAEITNGASGGVRPREQEGPPEQPETFNDAALPGIHQSSADGRTQDVSEKAGVQGSEHSKHLPSWAHRSGQKEVDPKEGKEGSTFSKWAFHTARKLGDVVASKDLTDDPSKKSNKK